MKKEYRLIFLLIFFVSGFSGLIYESIWTQYLKLFLGHAAYAQTLVLIIFMGGMAIGSYIASRYSMKWKNLFVGYAIVEMIIGILALIFHESFTSFLELSYDTAFKSLETPFSVNLYKWLTSAFLILPQSILLGTTFPLMSAAIIRSFPRSPGKNISLLYFTNSLGAAIGVLVSGFYFINAFGLPGTIRIAGILNIFVAFVVLYLIRRSKTKTQTPIAVSPEPLKKVSQLSNITFLLLSVSAFTGMASFIYEVGWIRMLNMVLGTSNHAFELMLSAFIFGLAFGGFWIRKKIDKMVNPIAYLGYVQIIMGIMALSTLLFYGNTFNFMQWVMETVSKDDQGYFIFNLASNGIALLIMFPATFFAGMTLPIITTILLKKRGERSIGSVYAWNTIGGIVGVIFAVHVGMPFLGLKGMISLGAGIDLLLGMILLYAFCYQDLKQTKKLFVSTGIAGIALLYIVFFFSLDPYKMASGVYRGFSLLDKNINKVLFNEDGKTASISVVRNEDYGGILSLRTNGKTDASIYFEENSKALIDESTTFQLAIIPMALHPEAKHVANIGLGVGTTTKTMLDNPNIQSVHTVEIEKEVVNAAKQLGPKIAPIFTDSRSRIVIDDAKSFFASGQRKYDIIVSEPSNPWISGISGLFSLEFYSLINKHLNNDGVFAQWVHFYNLDLDLVVSIFKAVSLNFNDYEIYILNNSECLIVAKKEGFLPPLDEELLSLPQIAKSLQHINVKSMQDIEFRLLGNKKILTPYLESFSISANSDYFPVLDQNATRARFLNLNAKEIYGFTHHYHPVVTLLGQRKHVWDKTKVALSQFYNKSKEVSDAMELYDFFVNGNDFNYSLLPEDVRIEAKHTKELFKTNSNQASVQNRVPILLNTSIRMTPYLSPKEMNEVWNALGVNQDPTITEEEQTWISLFQAIGQGDSQTMVSTSEDLLSKYTQGLPAKPKEYLVSAAMLGYIMQGQLDKAQVVYWQNNGNLSVNPQSKMLFDFLLSNCSHIH